MIIRSLIKYCGLASLALISATAMGQVRDDIPSCYSILGNGAVNAAPNRELVVLIDQTVVAPQDLKLRVHEQVQRFIQPGDKITIAKFSAYVEGNYTTVNFTGQTDRDLSDDLRYSTSKRKLQQFDKCMKQQVSFYRSSIDKNLKDSFGITERKIPNTELVGNLKVLTEELLVKTNNERKVVLIFSDMLENSATSSFYGGGKVRVINPQVELDKFTKAGLLGNYGNSDIYVMGAGLVTGGGYRSEAQLRGIRNFWSQYFKASNGNLVGWGQPDLLSAIK